MPDNDNDNDGNLPAHTVQRSNRVGGDQAGRDITTQNAGENYGYVYQANTMHFSDAAVGANAPPYVLQLNERIRSELEGGGDFQEMIDRLRHYTSVAEFDTRSLEDKLEAGERNHEVREALYLKEQAYKLIMRYTSYQSAQELFVHLLAEIACTFKLKIQPMIADGADLAHVNHAIHDEILAPVMGQLDSNPLAINKDDLRSFIYYLTGNCHLAWD